MTVRLTALALVSASLVVACGNAGPELRPAARTSTLGPGAIRSAYDVAIRLEITGDSTYTIERDAILDAYVVHGTSVPVGLWTLTASTGSFDVTGPDGALLIWSADLLPGTYDGPGTYTIDGKDAPPLAPASSLRSGAYIQIARPTPGDDAVTRYEVLVEPCTLSVAPELATGRVECPKLGLDRDPSRTISWVWTWERLTGTAASPSS